MTMILRVMDHTFISSTSRSCQQLSAYKGQPRPALAHEGVVRAFQGRISLHDCLFKKKICPDAGTCPLRKAIGRLEDRLVAELEALTIASILEGDKVTAGSPRARVKGRASSIPARTRRHP